MYLVGKAPAHAQRLSETCFAAMWRGIEAVRPRARLGDIGHAIQSFVERNDYSVVREYCGHGIGRVYQDRKSTRLNSSHSQISYAVFCLKKKKNQTYDQMDV